ncbi:sushi, von Willebrand factor type A, EGF and pentraxin domain-containing protein 1-like [Dreissena polymorpha]|uniref:sushi, von Willebrand factor type A, EGF and pentraxin domain-containing protein 1-like n=1 Tax=Dreissena polymorpha TaxID=45954 RepID=UPI002265103C|nr:sushi, von Willebrand factor type A, EGF and pentraxin domain-containing protein 1-like [Dreissena polymorpha]
MADEAISVVECPVYDSLKNGRVKASGNKYGNVVELQCDEGYYLAGKSSLKCGANGNWDDDFQTFCAENQCVEPSGISNGFVSASSWKVGATATYTCSEGFRLHGSNQRVCSRNGKWNGSDPYCRMVICEVPPPVEHAKTFDALTQYLYQFEVRYVCKTGYFISDGDALLRCSESGQWIGKVPKCSLVKCKEPVAPAKSKVLVASLTYGSEAQYLCFPGYRLKGSTTVRCDETGNWKGVVPECVPIASGNPPVVANSIVVDSGDHTYNNQILYNWHVGFIS